MNFHAPGSFGLQLYQMEEGGYIYIDNITEKKDLPLGVPDVDRPGRQVRLVL